MTFEEAKAFTQANAEYMLDAEEPFKFMAEAILRSRDEEKCLVVVRKAFHLIAALGA